MHAFRSGSPTGFGVKKWIASSEGFAKGALHLDAGAAAAVSQSKAASILAVGVTAVEGISSATTSYASSRPKAPHWAWAASRATARRPAATSAAKVSNR